ncbi:MAG: GAF domain-containing protein [Planctomycetota bacterium]
MPAKDTILKLAPSNDLASLNRAYVELAMRLTLLEKLQHLFVEPEALEANVEKALDIFMEAFDTSSGSILLYDEDRDDLFFAAARGPKAAAIMKFRLKKGEGLAGAAAESRAPVVVSDASRDPRFSQEIAHAVGYEVRSLLAVPILFKGNMFGVVELLNRRKTDLFNGTELALAAEGARILGMLIAIGSRLRN